MKSKHTRWHFVSQFLCVLGVGFLSGNVVNLSVVEKICLMGPNHRYFFGEIVQAADLNQILRGTAFLQAADLHIVLLSFTFSLKIVQ